MIMLLQCFRNIVIGILQRYYTPLDNEKRIQTQNLGNTH